MTLEIILILIGLATVLFLACVYATILSDKHKVLIDFLLIEILRLEGINGNVMVEKLETGETWFCSLEEYEENKDEYRLVEGLPINDIEVLND